MQKDLESTEPLKEPLSAPQAELSHNKRSSPGNADQQPQAEMTQVYTLDMAYEKIGGFGRLQKVAMILLTLMRNSGMYFFYCFGFLTLDQTYLCRQSPDQPYVDCPAEEICQARDSGTYLDWITNKEDPNYLENWIQQMMLMCVTRVNIQWIVFIYYIAYGVSGFLLWPIPDKMGRKFTLGVFGSLHLASQWVMLLCPNYWVRFAGFVALGAFQLKNNICFTMLFEINESKYKAGAISVLNGFDVLSMAITCIYFITISRNWFPLYFTMTAAGTFSFILSMIIIPESPKWLMVIGREKEAIEALNKIARINGSSYRFPNDKSIIFLESLAYQQGQDNTKSTNLESKNDQQDEYFHEQSNYPSYWQQISQTSKILSGSKKEYLHDSDKILNRSSQKNQSVNQDDKFINNTTKQFPLWLLYVQLGFIFPIVAVVSYQTYFCITAVKGDRFLNGIVLGVGELSSCLLSGWLLEKIKDKNISLGSAAICAVSNILFYLSDPSKGGFLTTFLLLMAVMGVGGMVNLNYFLMESRVPIQYQGGSMVILMTISTLVGSVAAQVSYLPHPIPLYTLLSFVAAFTGFVLCLPNHINQDLAKDDQLKQIQNSQKANENLSQDDSNVPDITLIKQVFSTSRILYPNGVSLYRPCDQMGARLIAGRSIIQNQNNLPLPLLNQSSSFIVFNKAYVNKTQNPHLSPKMNEVELEKQKQKSIKSKWGIKN